MYLRARTPVTFSHSTIYIGLQPRGYIPTLKNETDVNGLVSCREKQAIKFSQIYSKQLNKLKGEEARAEGGEIMVFDN